ncbi:MAG: hypothetical protein AAF730_07155 [Bacteroidota bacterium]
MYDARAIHAILQRAAELDHKAQPKAEPTLSRDELMQLSRDTGIDAAAMQHAIDEVGTQSASPIFARQQQSRTFSRLIQAPMTDAVWQGLIERLRAQFNTVGTVYYVGAAREWHFSRNGEQVIVSIRPDGKQTRVTAYAQRKPRSGAYVDSFILGLFLVATWIFSGFFSLSSVGLLAASVLWPSLQKYYQNRRLTRRLAQTQAAADAIEAIYAAPSAQATPNLQGADWLEDADLYEAPERQPTAPSRVRDQA